MTLEADLIESLAERARSVTLADGEVLVEQGDAADKVYFIESGSVSASKTTLQGDVVVGTVGAGQVIGEVTVVAGGRRTATLTAVGRVEVLEIERADFEDWLNSHPEMPHYGDGPEYKLAAAWLIEQCGFKQRGGDVRVHPEHALVIINPQHCSATEIEAFAGEISQAVQDRFGIVLEQEPRSYG